MNCKKCGNILQPTDTFCKNCGEPITESQIETNNAATPNPIGGMTFMTPPTESQTNQNQPQTISPSSEPTVTSVLEQNNNVAEQPVVEPQMTLNQSINTQNETMPFNNQPTPVSEQNNNVMEQPVTQGQMTLNQSINNQIGGMPLSNQAMINQQLPNNLAQTQVAGATMQDEPAEPTKKKNSPILVIILVIALIGIVGFEVIYFVKPFDKKKNDTNTIDNNNQEVVTSEENDEYASWMNYLLDQNIVEITLERTTEDSSENKTTPLEIDDLKTIFERLKEYPLVKKYLEGTGFTNGDKLTIVYAKEDNNYEVIIANGMIYADDVMLKDDDLRNALEESDHTTESEELKDKEGVFYNYIFRNFDNTIYDEFFVTEKIEENQ